MNMSLCDRRPVAAVLFEFRHELNMGWRANLCGVHVTVNLRSQSGERAVIHYRYRVVVVGCVVVASVMYNIDRSEQYWHINNMMYTTNQRNTII